jgi:hypothetical protein
MRRICLAALLIFASCFIAAAQEQQYGTVYFIRGFDTPDWPQNINVLNPEAVVYFNGKEFLSLPERTFVGFKVPVGHYEFRLKQKGRRMPLDVEADKTYYLHVAQTVYPYLTQYFFTTDVASALEAIRRYDALKEKKVKLKVFELIRTKPDAKKKS